MNEKIENILSRTILNQKQAKIYLACLEVGKAGAPQIARKAGLKRTTTYGILDELVDLGFLSYSSEGKTKVFKPQNPNVLVELLESKREKIEKILPDLDTLFQGQNIRPKLQFFEGKEGIKRIFEDILDCQSKKVCQLVKVKDWIEFLGKEYTYRYMEKRAGKGIVAYDLHPKSGDIYDEKYGRESEKWKRRVRYLPPSVFYISMLMIYDNKVAMVSTKEENFGFIIESKEFSNAQRALFELMWQLGSKDPEE